MAELPATALGAVIRSFPLRPLQEREDLLRALFVHGKCQDSEVSLAVNEFLWKGGDQTTRLRRPDALPALRLAHDRAPAQDDCAGLSNFSLCRVSAQLQ